MFPVIVTPGLSRAEILLSYSKLYNAQTKAQSYFTGLEATFQSFHLKIISSTFRSQRKAKNKAKQKKNQMFLVRISIKKRAGGQFFLFFIISYCMPSLHIITFPQGYAGPCEPCL